MSGVRKGGEKYPAFMKNNKEDWLIIVQYGF